MQVNKVQSNMAFEGCGGKNRMCKEAIKRITKMAEEKGLNGTKMESYIQEQLNRQQKTNFLHIFG